MNTVTVRAMRGRVELEGIELADARDIFGEAEERFGRIVVECSATAVRSKLRDAGYRTRAAS